MNWISKLDRAGPRVHLDVALGQWTQLPSNALQLSELVLPEQANHYGTLFGPNALALLGKAAFLVASRYCQQPVVMAAATRIDFHRPIPVGAILNLRAQVVRVGRSSMSVEVSAALDAAPGLKPENALSAAFDMVTVDEHGRPTPVSPPQRIGECPRVASSTPSPI